MQCDLMLHSSSRRHQDHMCTLKHVNTGEYLVNQHRMIVMSTSHITRYIRRENYLKLFHKRKLFPVSTSRHQAPEFPSHMPNMDEYHIHQLREDTLAYFKCELNYQ